MNYPKWVQTLLRGSKPPLTSDSTKGIALHIRTKVLGARSDPDSSSRRWPFELIQNAHDAGTRTGHESISLSFRLTDGVLRFEHDATPFTMDEFAALLTGGSSKDFMSTETTGRFGTGFLVTHVLSEQVEVSGILEVDGSYRAFEVDLDRPNDEGLRQPAHSGKACIGAVTSMFGI
jgi:hypothetical protein